MLYDLILKNGILVTSKECFYNKDIAVKEGKIAFIGKIENYDSANEVYDCSDKYILPGIIDAHVHFRDPGLTEKEDFETGSIAAAFGGITMIADMPNVLPPTSTAERFKEKVRIAKDKSYIDFALFALLNNENTHEMEGMKNEGALGFKIFLGTSTGDIASPSLPVMYEQMKLSASLKMRIGFHAETSPLNDYFTSIYKNRGSNTECKTEGILLSDARPVFSEALAIQTALCYAKYTGANIHIHHITSSDGALLIQNAKKEGVNVKCETCPHYLFLSANKGDANKVYPPIRDESHHVFLWEKIMDGTIDMLASDHAPHSKKEKNRSIWDSSAGLTGVETFVPLFLNEVNKGRINIIDFVRLASETPAKIWGLYPKKGSLQIDADADFTIVDMNKKMTLRADELHSKSKTCAYEGFEVQGLPVSTIVRGSFVMKDRILTGKKGYGKLIR